MALYDAKEKKKISENFYFDVTPEQIKKMLGGHIPYQDVSTLSRSCVFSMSSLSTDVFLVVKVGKMLYLSASCLCIILVIHNHIIACLKVSLSPFVSFLCTLFLKITQEFYTQFTQKAAYQSLNC